MSPIRKSKGSCFARALLENFLVSIVNNVCRLTIPDFSNSNQNGCSVAATDERCRLDTLFKTTAVYRVVRVSAIPRRVIV